MTLIVCVLILVLHSDQCKMQCILGSGIEMLLFLLQFQSICGLCSTVGWLCTQPSTQAFIHKQPLYNPLPRVSYTNNPCATPVLCTQPSSSYTNNPCSGRNYGRLTEVSQFLPSEFTEERTHTQKYRNTQAVYSFVC